MSIAGTSELGFGPGTHRFNDSSTSESKIDRKPQQKVKNPELKRMTIALPQESARMLELLSELQGITQVEALRRAISTEAFMQREIKNGSRILVQSPDNQMKELVFR
jgi:hypothetical protein